MVGRAVRDAEAAGDGYDCRNMSASAPHIGGNVSEEATAVEAGESERQRIEALMRHLIELRAAGDVAGLAAFAAPDIVFKTGIRRAHPFHSEYHGVEACAKLLRDVNVCYENLGSRLNKLVIDGDRVAMHRTARIRNRGTGRAVDIGMWNFVTFRNGLIVEFAEYPDTEAFAQLEAAD